MKNKLVVLSLFLVLNFSLAPSIFSDDSKVQSSVLNKSVSSVLSDSSSKEFVILAIKTVYRQVGFSPESINGIIDVLFSHDEMDLEIVSKRLRTYIERTNFVTIYQKYKIGAYGRRFSLFQRFVEGPLVADIGCGSGDLSEAIIQNIPSVRKIIATDIKEYHKITNPLIEFKPQLQPDKIPIDSNVVDTAILIYVLHHVEERYQKNLLKELHRILKKGGKVIILEDTYSNTLQPEYGRKLLKKFLKFDDKRKKEVLAFSDWLCNKVFEKLNIAMPYTFKSMEEWEDYFNKAEFYVKHKQFLGTLKNGLSLSPKGFFVLEKISNLPNQEKLPAVSN